VKVDHLAPVMLVQYRNNSEGLAVCFAPIIFEEVMAVSAYFLPVSSDG
jgi:hypothetical protein